MIKLNQRCEQLEEIAKKIKNNMMISYLTAFARSRQARKNRDVLKHSCDVLVEISPVIVMQR